MKTHSKQQCLINPTEYIKVRTIPVRGDTLYATPTKYRNLSRQLNNVRCYCSNCSTAT